MTDLRDDEQNGQRKLSFKEQILAELEKANQIRKEKEEELIRQDLKEEELRLKEEEVKAAAKRTTELYREYNNSVFESQTIESYLDKSKNDNSTYQSESLTIESRETKSEQSTSGSTSEKSQMNESETTIESIDFSKTIAFKPITVTDIASESTDNDYSEHDIVEKQEVNASYPEEDNRNTSEVGDSEAQTLTGDFMQHRKVKRDKVAKKISSMVILGSILLLILLGLLTGAYVYRAINPVDKNDDKYVQVEIPVGAGNKLIGQTLEKNGLIKDSTVFNLYTKFKNFTNFQSGYYNLQKSMSLSEIAKSLQKGGTEEPSQPVLGKIVVPEGYTIKQIANSIESNANTKSTKDKTPFKSEEFLKLVSDETFIKQMVKKYPNLLGSIPSKADAKYQLEGYLFPATYNYFKGSTLEEVVDQMLAATDATMSPYYETIASQGKTVNDVLTLASLVEKEGSTDEDRRNIASVFYNRLNNGMALQSNIAILYAMDKLGQKTTLAEDAGIDTSINSPYNIYTNTGLMPGPVDNPGVSAIDATVNPAKTDYLYFVANVKTGEVFYAKTFEEHSANVEKYVNNQIN